MGLPANQPWWIHVAAVVLRRAGHRNAAAALGPARGSSGRQPGRAGVLPGL